MFQKLVTLAAWGSLAFITFATLSPIGLRPHVADVGYEHVAAFAVAGLLFGLVYPRRIILVVALVLGSAILLEVLQLVTPDRHGRLLDLGLKLLGGSIGIAFAWVRQLLRSVASAAVAKW
jgi:VanZ family protein